jgi:molybdopterin biosynthesis enzyme
MLLQKIFSHGRRSMDMQSGLMTLRDRRFRLFNQEILMSQKADFALPEDNASKIPTGGMLPENADAVVMFEHVQIIDEQMIEVLKPVAPGENVIQVGEDVKKGDVVIRAGHRLRPQDISLQNMTH